MNENHWAAADGLSADAAASPSVRRTLRNRGRYEVANNSFLRGVVETLSNDIIGTGPRLQCLLKNREENRRIEERFHKWALAVKFARKLRIARKDKLQGGEAVAVMFTNPKLPTSAKIDMRLVECDRLASPYLMLPRENHVDGITFDEYGNPVTYDILDQHPGAFTPISTMDYTEYPAEHVMHWFRSDRAGQHRGLPEVMAALWLFAVMRRFTEATLCAAETAANFAAILHTDSPPETGDIVAPAAWDEIEIVKDTMLAAPDGWRMSQFKAEHPNTTYVEFKNEVQLEAVRCILVPRNIAAGDSSGYNFASGRLDHKTYWTFIGVERFDCEQAMVEPMYEQWEREESLLRNVPADVPHKWMWPGMVPGDPLKEAKSIDVRLVNNTTTLSDEYAKLGLDWEEQVIQRAKEKKLVAALELTEAEAAPKPDHEHEDDDDEEK